jgi:hypothetical protein
MVWIKIRMVLLLAIFELANQDFDLVMERNKKDKQASGDIGIFHSR